MKTEKRLQEINGTIRRVIAGDCLARINASKQNDGLGALAQNLNTLIDELHEYRNNSIHRSVYEKALKKAKLAAKEAHKAKGEFLANMSHEIRTPMNGIVGMIDLLLGTEMTDEQMDYAAVMAKSANSLLTIVNDILDFAKIESGTVTIEGIPFDLRVLVKEVVEIMSPEISDRDVDLIVRYAPNIPHRYIGDPERLRQILIHLVNNAIKFTPRGHVLVAVEQIEQIDDTAIIAIAVEDTGVGIPENKVHDIFEVFSQGDMSTTRKYGGAGLGLAISKKLVEAMGGTIVLSSEEEKGSRFEITVSLPVDGNVSPAMNSTDRGGKKTPEYCKVTK